MTSLFANQFCKKIINVFWIFDDFSDTIFYEWFETKSNNVKLEFISPKLRQQYGLLSHA